MKKIEIAEIISLFSLKEFKRLGDYIRSPFFGFPQRVTALYEFIEKNYDAVIKNKISRDQIAAIVLKKANTPVNQRRLFSDFNKTIEGFLQVVEFEADDNYKTISQLKSLLANKDFSSQASYLLEQKFRETEKKLSKMPDDDNKFRLAAEYYRLKNLSEPASDFHEFSLYLQSESDMLDAYYICSKLYIFQQMYSKQILNKVRLGYKWNMYEQITDFIEANKEDIKQKFPSLYVMFLMTKMAAENNDSLIEEYGTFLDSQENSLTTKQLTDYYSDLYNYLSIRIGAGRHDYRKLQFNLVKSLDEKKLLYDAGNGKIHSYTFKQITDTAFNLGELDFADKFIKHYGEYIDDINKKNIVALAAAKLHYFKNDFSKARLILKEVRYSDYIYYLDSKKMLICIEYDSENFIEVDLIIDSLNKYIKKHEKIPTEVLENTKTFINYIKAMLNIIENPEDDNFMAEKLRSVITGETRPVYALEWLKSKIELLVGNKVKQ